MATIKSYTDLEQSKKLVEILPIESADMYYFHQIDNDYFPSDVESIRPIPLVKDGKEDFNYDIGCWSLAALFKYLSEIKPKVYTLVLFPSEGKWILQFVEHGHGNVCEVSCDNPVDACVAMIEQLHELKML